MMRKRVLFLVLIIIALLSALGLQYQSALVKQSSVHNEVLALKEQINMLEQQLSVKNIELSIAQQSNDQMKDLFDQQIDQQHAIMRELDFYRTVMSPESKDKGLNIQRIGLTPLTGGNQWQLNLVLMQLELTKKTMLGHFDVAVHGLLGEQLEVIQLTEENDKRSQFDFQYFQRFNLKFAVPEGFEIKAINVKLSLDQGKKKKPKVIEREYSVTELIPQ